MAFDYINEAFKRLDLLEEQMFDTSLKGINELSDFFENDTEDVIRVIDPEAETEEDIQDSYVGKVIINCNVCHSHVFENKEEIKIEESGDVNIDTRCPYCGEEEGFTIVGEIVPFVTDVISDEEVEETSKEGVVEEAPPEDDSTEEPQAEIEEGLLDTLSSFSPAAKLASKLMDSVEESDDKDILEEDFKEVTITTDDQHMEMTSDNEGKVTVTTEPIKEESENREEIIAPVSDESIEEIIDNNISSEESTEEIVDPVQDEVDFEFDDIDEASFDELGEGYLKSVYENVESFKTSNVSANSNTLIVEGIISFTSGKKKKTGFVFESKDYNNKGKLRFIGCNKHLCESKDAFSLVGSIENKKLFVESLKYSYNVNEEPVRGVIRRK